MSAAVLSLMAETVADTLHRDGYVVVRNVIDPNATDDLLENLRWLCERETAQSWTSLHSVSLAKQLAQHRDQRRHIIERAKVPAWLLRFALQSGITSAIHAAFGGEAQLLRNVELNLDVPVRPEDMDVWHQDHFLVRGSSRTLAAWVPLQDTGSREGCLHVMPGSHRMGPLPHDTLVLGHRHTPRAIEDREIRMVPVKAGDVVLMHTMLLRTTGMNLSPAIRGSLLARFIPRGAKWSRTMGGVVDVPSRV